MEEWLEELSAGRAHAAWDLFVERYRRLILATIRRLVRDHDDVMDVFASICMALAADDCARLRACAPRPGGRDDTPAAPWVVAVVRNLTIDWLRHRDGRPRRTIPASLSPLQQGIYRAVCLDGASYRAAYETVSAVAPATLTYGAFLREVRETQRLAPCPGDAPRRPRETPLADAVIHADGAARTPPDALEERERGRRLTSVLASCPDDVRAAVLLFVVEGMAADDVARVVGWPNGKAVYNRVHRALAVLRRALEREGIGRGDL